MDVRWSTQYTVRDRGSVGVNAGDRGVEFNIGLDGIQPGRTLTLEESDRTINNVRGCNRS